MKISVLMPTYECPLDLLHRSVSSVLGQTHKDTELIIKDGSIKNPVRIDGSSYVGRYLAQHSSRVKYVCSPDGPPKEDSGVFGHNGFYEALNTCISIASGDVLCLLCSDDELATVDTLEYVNSEFEKHGQSPFLLYGSCDWIDRDGKYFDSKKPPVITFNSLLNDYTLYTPSLFWNRAVHQCFGLFDEKLAWCADMDFWLKCLRHGLHTKRSSKTLGRYRVWETSQARANEPSLWEQSSAIQRRHREGQ